MEPASYTEKCLEENCTENRQMYLLSINCISVSLAFKNWKGKMKDRKINNKTALVDTCCHTLGLQVLSSHEQILACEKTAIKHRKGLVANTLLSSQRCSTESSESLNKWEL